MKTLIRFGLVLGCTLASSLALADKDFDSGSGASWDCGSDPTVNINHGGGTFTFKGACKAINVNGGGVTVAIESVDELNVNGASNKVTVDAVDAINVIGAQNAISWKKGKTGDKPAVAVVGERNKVSGPAKAAKKPTKG